MVVNKNISARNHSQIRICLSYIFQITLMENLILFNKPLPLAISHYVFMPLIYLQLKYLLYLLHSFSQQDSLPNNDESVCLSPGSQWDP